MKSKINLLILFALLALISFTACQDEASEVDNPSQQETIVANSTLANLMSRITANFGATDDVLDGASCFSVELPVTIIVSDFTIIIETEDDLEQLEDLFEDYDGDNDFLDFIFPITIIFSDYTELVIASEDQLENFISECDDDDDVVECIDFVYPISFSVFNSVFNLIDTVVVENDEALYLFLNELENDDNVLIVSLNYPVTLEYVNEETIEVNTNEELVEAINAAGDDCEDENDCEDDDVIENLVECPWEVSLYTNNDLENLDGPYSFIFNQNGNVVIEGVFDDPYTTTWALTETDIGLELNIESFYYYEQQYGNWLVVECDDDDLKFEHLTVDGTGLFFDKDCENELDCSVTDISEILQECPWNFTDATGNFNNYQMIFNANGDMQITEGAATSAIGGGWSLSVTNEGLILTFSELTAFQDNLGGDWLIVECDDDEFTILQDNTVIELDQDCENNDDLFSCFSDFELLECANDAGEAEFNLSGDTIGLIICTQTYVPSFHASLADAESNLGAIPNTESYFSISGQVYLRIEAESGNYQIFTIYLNTEECNLFECFQSFDAVIDICDEQNDGIEVFDLTIAFANCTPEADVVTYYETEADAYNHVNPIANPQIYTNVVANQQTIYVRVEINNQFEIFTIQLILEDCSEDSCSEEDVDTFLLECIWNAVNYNGSDNLLEWNFDFESMNQIVVLYTETQTIDATWSTSASSDGVIVEFTNVAGSNIQAITGEWLVVECEVNRLELHRENDILVLERTCN